MFRQKGRCEVSIDKAMGNGIHCAGCTFVTLQLKPSDMYCPWCMGEAKARIAELEAMVREVIDAGNASYGKLDVWHTTADKAIALLNQEERKDGAK